MPDICEMSAFQHQKSSDDKNIYNTVEFLRKNAVIKCIHWLQGNKLAAFFLTS